MKEKDLGKNYDKIAEWWTNQMKGSDYGMNFIRKAMDMSSSNSSVLDVGCGSTCRVYKECSDRGFKYRGIDVSSKMVKLSKEKNGSDSFIHKGLFEYETEEKYDLITAWDSIFHTERSLQGSAVEKMCSMLNKDGILLFTAGGINDERSGEMEGVPFEYGSLDYMEYLQIIRESGCRIVLMERDQLPYDHMVFICQKI